MEVSMGMIRGMVLVVMAALLMGTGEESRKVATGRTGGRTGPFVLGADVTWLLEDEAAGATFYDKGVRRDLLEILADRGFNCVRVRVFVDPLSERGYARRMGRRGSTTAEAATQPAWGGLGKGIELAKRAQGRGMQVLVDIFYSDTWADPEHQVKPAAWEGKSVAELVELARVHTREVMLAFVEAGVEPAFVQVGNEITHGMLWPEMRVMSGIPSGNTETDGRMKEAAERFGLDKVGGGLGHYDELAAVLKVCIAEVRATSPKTKVMLHNHLGRFSERVLEWLGELSKRGVRFDVLGLSCYAQGKEGDWGRTFADVAEKYPELEILVAEYSARKRYVNDLVFGIPGKRGLGTLIWEPVRHREALFDQNGVNAGGGQASDFVGALGVNQGATTQSGQAPGGATRPASRPRVNRGGRFDGNGLLELYPEMVRAYRD